MHGAIYELLNLDAETIRVADPDVKKLVSKIRAESIGLTAVTMPFKKSVMPFLNKIDKVAKRVGADFIFMMIKARLQVKILKSSSF